MVEILSLLTRVVGPVSGCTAWTQSATQLLKSLRGRPENQQLRRSRCSRCIIVDQKPSRRTGEPWRSANEKLVPMMQGSTHRFSRFVRIARAGRSRR